MSDIWRQIESGKDRRRRLAFERSFQQAVSQTASTKSNDKPTKNDSVGPKAGASTKITKKTKKDNVMCSSVDTGDVRKKKILNLSESTTAMDQECVASLSKTITSVIKQSSNAVDVVESDTHKKQVNQDSKQVLKGSFVTNQPKEENGNKKDIGRKVNQKTNGDHSLKIDPGQNQASDRKVDSEKNYLLSDTVQNEPALNATTYAAMVLKNASTELNEATDLNETDDLERHDKTEQSQTKLFEGLSNSVWLNKSVYNEAESDFYAKSGKHDNKRDSTSESENENKENQPVPSSSSRGVWLKRSNFNEAEKSFYESTEKHKQRNTEQSESVDEASSAGILAADSMAQSPPSLPFELDDMYYEDMILPGRESEVTMAHTPGFTATELNESLLPYERMDSLQTEAEFDRMLELNPDSLVQVPLSYAAMAACKPTNTNPKVDDNVLITNVADNNFAIKTDTEVFANRASILEKLVTPASSTKPDTSPTGTDGWKAIESKKKRKRRNRSGHNCDSEESGRTDNKREVEALPDVPICPDSRKLDEVLDTRSEDKKYAVPAESESDQSHCATQIRNDSSECLSVSYNLNEKSPQTSATNSESPLQLQQDDPQLVKYKRIGDDTFEPVKRPKMIESNLEPLMQSDRILLPTGVSRPILADHNMYLSSDEGKTYASLMQQGSDMLAARSVFMAHACHVCKQLHSKHNRLKSCGNCRLVAYCSPQHQRAHWPLHRDFCKLVTKYAQRMGVEHIYEDAHNVSNEEKWNEIRYKHMSKCEELLGRPLETNEKEMFLYPRVCQTCHETASEKLRTCTECHSVSFCCQQHMRPNHSKYCKSLRLLVEINRYQNKRGICNPPLPEKILENYEQLASGVREFLTVQMLGPQRAHQMGSIELTVLSDHASYPLSLVYALQNVANIGNGPSLAERQSLVVHVVGAESGIECDIIDKWDALLLRILPALRRLHIIFVGIDLEVSDRSETSATIDRTSEISRRAGKQFLCEIEPHTAYHDFCLGPRYRKPDVVCAFNAGFHRFAGHTSRDCWLGSLKHLVAQQAPLVITGFSALDVQQDVTRIGNVQQVEKQGFSVLLPPMKNPYRSTRPLRNYLVDHDDPLVYRNQYIACMAGVGLQD